ncbi:MAG: hypothetical protein HOJ10_12605 [Marinovum sp.]|nr:hypothetical protein [Marinovum sp.]
MTGTFTLPIQAQEAKATQAQATQAQATQAQATQAQAAQAKYPRPNQKPQQPKLLLMAAA